MKIKVNLAERRTLGDLSSQIENLKNMLTSMVTDIVVSRGFTVPDGIEITLSRDCKSIEFEDNTKETNNLKEVVKENDGKEPNTDKPSV